MGRKYFRLIFLKDFVRHFSTDFSQFVPNGHLCLDSIGLLSNYMILPPPLQGLFSRRRTLLLTTGPHLYYVDPSTMVLKGEIPFSPALRVEPKNFKIFFVHTPSRTYYLEDPEGYALEWTKAIDEVRLHTYGEESSEEDTS